METEGSINLLVPLESTFFLGGSYHDGHRIAGNSIASLTFAGGELPV